MLLMKILSDYENYYWLGNLEKEKMDEEGTNLKIGIGEG